ncbi:hypothetical protein D917_09567 [Trichinella nativa]|uniref:Uncharacterized protein n=1 Tax=Trichinella nativa TaxID=6335 RepID=A0A1Y3EIS1_9BILA|nr:hypothetical protein D917_09567 [Trichinella nativa]
MMEQPLKDDIVSKVEDTLNYLLEEVTELLDSEDSLSKENVFMQEDDTDDEQSNTEIKPTIILNVEQRLFHLLLKSYDLLIFSIAQQFRIVSEEIERTRGGLPISLKECEVSFEQFSKLIHSEHLEKQVNLMYEYVGVWKIEEFLIPNLKPNDLVIVLRNLPDPRSFYETMKITVLLLLCLRRDDYVGNDSHVLSVRKTRIYLKFLLHQRELITAKLRSVCHEQVYQSIINDSSERDSSILRNTAPDTSSGSARPDERKNKNSKQRQESLMKIRCGLLQRSQKSVSESETSSSLRKSKRKSSKLCEDKFDEAVENYLQLLVKKTVHRNSKFDKEEFGEIMKSSLIEK